MNKNSKPESILSAASNSSIVKAKIYEYDFDPLENRKNVLKQNFNLLPWVFILIMNIFGVLIILAISFGILTGAGSLSSKQFQDSCTTSTECLSSSYFICSNQKCTCNSTSFYDDNFSICSPQLSNAVSCSSSIYNQCGYGQVCSFDQKSNQYMCQCTNDRFWNSTLAYCQKKISYNATGCTSSNHCIYQSNMTCVSNMCTCIFPNFWNGSFCTNVGSYLQPCSQTSYCDSSKLLNCSITGQTTMICICPINYFWSGTTCTPKLMQSVYCLLSSQCRDDLGLICYQNACQCNSTFNWGGSACTAKSNYLGACSATAPCNTGYSCLSNVCNCASGYFYNGNSCQLKMSYGISCATTYSSGCDSTKFLTCDSSTKTCICQANYYWSSIFSSCVLTQTNGTACSSNIQCQSNLVCNPTYGTCICQNGYYWDLGSLTCKIKVTYSQFCSFTYFCQDNTGLVCSSSACNCPTNYFWNNTICINQYLFGVQCTQAVQCQASLGLTCDTGVTNTCRCSSNSNYWNSNQCVSKIAYNIPCQYSIITNTNNQCQDNLMPNLVCLATLKTPTTWTCQCQNTYYYDGIGSCVQKKTYQSVCSNDNQCQNYFGLICVSNICKCAITQYWNATYNKCVDKLPMGSACLTSYILDLMCMDYAFASCISGICQCTSIATYFNTTYNLCLPRASHDQYCGDGTLCAFSSPRNLTCLPAAGYTCQCENYQNRGSSYYWSANSNNCISCPAGFTSGYGYAIQNSINSITTRCYGSNSSPVYSYNTGQAYCQNYGANLMTIRNTLEMGIASLFTQNEFLLWVGSSQIPHLWNYWFNNPILAQLYCPLEPYNNGKGIYISGVAGNCLDDISDSTLMGVICEINT